jgi:hypothetical protein
MRKEFPKIDFDAMPTANQTGGNRRWAVVLVRGIDNKEKACRIANFSHHCDIARDAYVYQLFVGPKPC